MTNRSQKSGQRSAICHWSFVITCQISLCVLRVSAVRLLGLRLGCPVFICGLLLVVVVTPLAEGLLTLPASGLSKRTVHCSDRCRMYLLRYATRSSTRSW